MTTEDVTENVEMTTEDVAETVATESEVMTETVEMTKEQGSDETASADKTLNQPVMEQAANQAAAAASVTVYTVTNTDSVGTAAVEINVYDRPSADAMTQPFEESSFWTMTVTVNPNGTVTITEE